MEFLLGIIFTLILEALAWFAYESWRLATAPDPPPQPQTAAQRANELAFDADQANHPRVVRMKLQRRVRRGRKAVLPEEKD